MRKRVFLLLLIFLIPLSACSRTPEIPNTEKIIFALCDSEIDLPSGSIYSSDVEPQSKNYLSDSILCAYFGLADIQKYKKDWTSYSIFVNHGSHACEFAAIYCSTPESLIDTTRLLASRLDSIKRNADGNFTNYTEQAQVVTFGNYAVLIISSDASQARKLVGKLI